MLCLPISLKEGQCSFIDALFTATSATCLTGLVVIPAADFTLFGQIVILLLIQIGGLGFMTIATMILIALKRKFSFSERLLMQEALGQDHNRGIVKMTLNVAYFTFITEAIGTLLLLPPFVKEMGAKGIYVALFTSISAFCNAGFDVVGPVSLESYATNPWVCLPICLLVIIGGIGFVVIADIAQKRKPSRFSIHTKAVLVVTASLLLSGTVLFMIAEYDNTATMGNMNFGEKLMAAFFQSVTSRTAGFATLPQQSLTEPSKFFTMLLMFIGGSPASTAGGIKTTTLFVTLLTFWAGLRRKSEVSVFHRTINDRLCYRAITSFIAGLIIVTGTAFLLMFTEANSAVAQNGLYSFENLFFEAISAFSTTGLSASVTPLLSVGGKILCCLAMYFGKVGVITLGAMFFTKPEDNAIRYPEGNILIV